MGAAAGLCTTMAYVPQVMVVSSVALWLGYGSALHDWVIVSANAATLLLTGIVLLLKLRHG